MSVSVLCPNGHRVTVKTTPNTSILQIIEDACKKYDFNPDLYELKHLRRKLDTSSNVRYTNLPNNSQLELVKAANPRVASNVNVNIATEGGSRLSYDFPSITTLLDILQHFSNDASGTPSLLPLPDQEVTLVYTMRRIPGTDLPSTTLKSLGITKGKCMFRHSIQAVSQANTCQTVASTSSVKTVYVPEGPLPSSGAVRKGSLHTGRENANSIAVVSAPGPDVTQKIIKSNEPDSTNNPSPAQDVPQPIHSQHSPSLPDLGINDVQVHALPERHSPERVMAALASRPNLIPEEGPDIVSSSQSPGIPDLVQSQSHFEPPDIVGNMGTSPMDLVPCDASPDGEVSASLPTQSQEMMDVDSSQPTQAESLPTCQDKVIPIGDHDAILFSLNDAPPVTAFEEDDSFFELSVNEVKKIYREYQTLLKEMENQPLRTKGMREMESQAKMLAALHQFPVVQLRVCFPDNYVIQASFKPQDTIQNVIDFIRPFLVQEDMEFALYNNYPRKKLQPEFSLVEADCIPKARIYFSTPESLPMYINEATMELKSTYNSANSAIIKSNRTVNKGQSTISNQLNEPCLKEGNATICSISKPSKSIVGAKKPKWFKLGK